MAGGITIEKKPESAKGAVRRILPYLTAYRSLLALVIALCLVSNIMALAPRWPETPSARQRQAWER